MDIKLYNTLTREKETFNPLHKGRVSMYVCGPTVYNYAHIGNLYNFIKWDILRRTLNYLGYDVKEVMNLTDVDDKTIRDSQKEGKTLKAFTEYYTDKFFDDIKSLNIEKAEVYPKATDHIKDMLELIDKLLKKKIAYKAKDGIYFDISKFASYGKLAKLDMRGLQVDASNRVKNDEYDKENVQDFVLWKFWDEQDGDVFWEPTKYLGVDTQIEKGRPGWHIECSAMSSKYLGQPFDIHTGAVDLIFPHHENEIAQSEAAFDKKFVNYWMHTEHLLVDNAKMSKSKHNFYVLSDITKRGFDPLAFRYLVISSQYRKKMNFTWKSLEAAQNALQKLKNYMRDIKSTNGEVLKDYSDKFASALSDDLNTPQVLAIVWEVVKSDHDDKDKYVTLLDFDKVLGLDLGKIEESAISNDVSDKLAKMDQARSDKNYELADQLRSQIEKAGYKVLNTPDGSKVERV